MERTLIKNIKGGMTVNLRGFVDTIRNQKSIQFIIIRDRSGKVQVTVFKPEKPEIASVFEGLNIGSVVSVTGKAVSAPNVKLGGVEIIPESVEVLSTAKLSPIDAETGPDLCMDYRWIDLRDEAKQRVFKIQTAVVSAMRDFCVENEFVEIMTPKLTATASEGGSEVFEVKYFAKKAYLTQSPQFYKQAAMAAGFENFFEFTPYYRAEKSYTSRHATEAFCFDVEISYVRDHHDVMDFEEKLLIYVMKKIEAQFGIPAQTVKFPRVTLLESYELLKKERNYEVPRASKGDLDPEGERLLCEIAKQKWNSDFIFVTDYPFAARAFYSMKHENDPKLSKSFDLLYKGVEVNSGAQREHHPDKLRDNLRAKGIDPSTMEFYIQFFEYGCPPHGGFGMGLARFVSRMLDLPTIRDATFLFRGPDRLAP